MKVNIFFILMILILTSGCFTSERHNEKSKLKYSTRCPEDMYKKVISEFGYRPDGFKIVTWSKINWLKQAKIISCRDIKGSRIVFMYKQGQYFRLNCPEGIPYINEVLGEYSYNKEDFQDIRKTESFLRTLTGMYDSYELDIATMGFLRMTLDFEIIEYWLLSTEKDENVFKEICFDPKYEFKGDQWEIYFNVFTVEGSVYQWNVKGEFLPKQEIVQIKNIVISEIKPKDTFSYPPKGGPGIIIERDYN